MTTAPLGGGQRRPTEKRPAGDAARHSGPVRSAAPDEPVNAAATSWLLLIYRIPSEPTRLRAGVWRKLKGIGAIYVQNSAAALPASPTAERALRTLRAEIDGMGGTAYLFESSVVGGQNHLLESFNAARDDEYSEIVDRCEDFSQQIEKEYAADHFTYAELEENDVDLAKLKGWLDKIRARDVFSASGQEAAAEAVARCEQILEEYASRVYAEEGESPPGERSRDTKD